MVQEIDLRALDAVGTDARQPHRRALVGLRHARQRVAQQRQRRRSAGGKTGGGLVGTSPRQPRHPDRSECAVVSSHGGAGGSSDGVSARRTAPGGCGCSSPPRARRRSSLRIPQWWQQRSPVARAESAAWRCASSRRRRALDVAPGCRRRLHTRGAGPRSARASVARSVRSASLAAAAVRPPGIGRNRPRRPPRRQCRAFAVPPSPTSLVSCSTAAEARARAARPRPRSVAESAAGAAAPRGAHHRSRSPRRWPFPRCRPPKSSSRGAASVTAALRLSAALRARRHPAIASASWAAPPAGCSRTSRRVPVSAVPWGVRAAAMGVGGC